MGIIRLHITATAIFFQQYKIRKKTRNAQGKTNFFSKKKIMPTLTKNNPTLRRKKVHSATRKNPLLENLSPLS